MATEFVTFSLPNYLPDWGTTPIPISGRFSRPPGMSAPSAILVLTAIGATAKSVNTKAPCAMPATFSPRRLKFSFASGGSLSVPFADKASGVSIATSLKSQLASSLGTTISCIELIGEEWGRVDEEIRPFGPAVPSTAGVDIRPTTGTKNLIYATSINYQTDTGANTVQNVKMNTDSLNNPYSTYLASINSAIGLSLPAGCGGSSIIKPRRYNIKIRTVNLRNPVRQMIVPVASSIAATIRAAGVEFLNNTQTLCLAYFGESDSRFSRLIP